MKTILVSAVMATLFISANASAADGKAIAAKNACLGCHAVDKKLVGPAYQDVAAKYKGQADAVAKLMKKVKAGGSGVWGPVPMPANPALSDADLKAVVEWVLAGAK